VEEEMPITCTLRVRERRGKAVCTEIAAWRGSGNVSEEVSDCC
jgi:hypothetical protein